MASATIYSTSKRHNSTSVPVGGSAIDVQLKGGCDLNKPVFLLYYDDSLGLPSMSEIQFGGRYYFVDSIRSIRDNLYEVSCSVDVLATYKTEILATSAFVKYYTHNNTEITDLRLSTKTTKTLQANEGVFDTLGAVDGTNGAIVLLVNGIDNVGAYAISQSAISSIINSTGFTTAIDNIVNNDLDIPILQNALDVVDWLNKLGSNLGLFVRTALGRIFTSGNALDNIRAAHMLPLSLSSTASSNTVQLMLGTFPTYTTVNEITDRIFSDGASVAIPWQAADWRRNAPYHELYLYIPYVGVIQLSPSDLIGETSLYVSCSLDKFSGDAIFTVKSGSGAVIGHYTTNLASQFPIGASNVTLASYVGGMISSAAGLGVAVGTLATGGAMGVAMAGASAAGIGLVNSIAPTNTSIGGATGAAALGLTDKSKIKCFSIFHDTTVAPSNLSAVFGTPYNAVLALSGISGYVQTVGASVSGNMTDDERREINALLDGGVYIE